MPGIQVSAAKAIKSCFNQSVCSIIKFFLARDAYDCRVQSLRRPDAAEEGNNVVFIFPHGHFEGSIVISVSGRVTLIQRKPRAALAAAAPVPGSQIGFGKNQQSRRPSRAEFINGVKPLGEELELANVRSEK
jgi:hypothetical protein